MVRLSFHLRFVLSAFLLIFLFGENQVSAVAVAGSEVDPARLELAGQTLFEFKQRLGSITPKERVEYISKRLQRLIDDNEFDLNQINILEDEMNGWDIYAGDRLLMVITREDAKVADRPAQELAKSIAQKLKGVIEADRLEKRPRQRLVNSLYALGITLLLVLALFAVRWSHLRFEKKIQLWNGTLIRAIQIKSYELVPADRIVSLASWLLNTLKFVAIISLFYVYVPLVLSLFPMTSKYSSTIFNYVLEPIRKISNGFLDFLPNLVFICVTIVIVRYILKFLRLSFMEIQNGRLHFKGFYQEWAEPTYQLIRFLVIAFSVVMIFPYIPGSSSPAFQGVTVFLGVIVSFGSSSAIANIIAGLVLTYMRSFKVGDRVKIAETMGDLVEKTILVTRIRTVKNVEVTIPNALVLASHILNYSTSANSLGLILNTDITIGYDAPWRTVHKLMIEAATKTGGILPTPQPFVLQTSLDDFYVRYEINAYTRQANSMARVYSELRENIQDAFNQAGVEIMSPAYAAIRDGNNVTIPTSVPADYKPKTSR
jgi:small-conductance mechanosensitive channel